MTIRQGVTGEYGVEENVARVSIAGEMCYMFPKHCSSEQCEFTGVYRSTE